MLKLRLGNPLMLRTVEPVPQSLAGKRVCNRSSGSANRSSSVSTTRPRCSSSVVIASPIPLSYHAAMVNERARGVARLRVPRGEAIVPGPGKGIMKQTVAILLPAPCSLPAFAASVRVAAAASLVDVLHEIGPRYEKQNRDTLLYNFAAACLLAR